MAPNAIYVGYMIVALALLLLVYTQAALDLRGVGRIKRRRAAIAADEAEYEDEETPRHVDYNKPEQFMIVPRADLAMLIALFGALGVSLGALTGFIGPRFIEMSMSGEMTQTALENFRWTAAKPLERVAQVTGAICFGLIALRMMRVFIGLAALVVLALGAHAAVAYTLGRDIWGPLGL